MRRQVINLKHLASVGLGALVLSVSACATVEPPLETMGSARMAIEEAQRLDAAQYSPAELEKAEEKLAVAKEELAAENNTRARRFAEQAVVDANLARTKTGLAKSRNELQNAQDALTDLRQELNRDRRY